MSHKTLNTTEERGSLSNCQHLTQKFQSENFCFIFSQDDTQSNRSRSQQPTQETQKDYKTPPCQEIPLDGVEETHAYDGFNESISRKDHHICFLIWNCAFSCTCNETGLESSNTLGNQYLSGIYCMQCLTNSDTSWAGLIGSTGPFPRRDKSFPFKPSVVNKNRS